jgi:hypothetical protein
MMIRAGARAGVALAMIAVLSVHGNGQHVDSSIPAGSIPIGGPFSRAVVLNAPLSADATTYITERLPNATAHRYTVTARYYRDSLGRVRAEMETPLGTYVVLATPDGTFPSGIAFYTLDAPTRTYQVALGAIAARVFNGEGRAVRPMTKTCFRVLLPPAASASDDERLRAVNARLAADLGIVVESHRADMISVDYEVTNIERAEPRADLFEVPTGYTLVRGSRDEPVGALAPWHVPNGCRR